MNTVTKQNAPQTIPSDSGLWKRRLKEKKNNLIFDLKNQDDQQVICDLLRSTYQSNEVDSFEDTVTKERLQTD